MQGMAGIAASVELAEPVELAAPGARLEPHTGPLLLVPKEVMAVTEAPVEVAAEGAAAFLTASSRQDREALTLTAGT